MYGPYDTDIKVGKQIYQSSFNQLDLNVIFNCSEMKCCQKGYNDGDAVGGNAVGGDGRDAAGGNRGKDGDNGEN
jgi:hypothetical protein